MCARTASRLEASWADTHLVEILRRRTESLLIGLLAAEEVEDRDAALDGIPDRVREQHDAGSQPGVHRIEAGVVQPDGPRVFEAEEAGDRGSLVLEEPEPRPSRAG